MDITILLWLQEFRNGIGRILAEFMAKMTFFGEIPTVLILMAVIYWCISKKFGTYLLMGWSGNRIVNGFLKVTACAYRPWIRDARIIPYGNAMETATGYSFPSGHSMNAASLFGGGAVRKDLSCPLRILLAFIAAWLFTASSDRIFVEVLSIIGSFAVYEAANIWISDKPHIRLVKYRLKKLENTEIRFTAGEDR